jgi:AcrR family transcriptional regulator
MATNHQTDQPAERTKERDERQLREERILDAAATLLVRWGYRKTTIDDVAREAGVGKGTIYLHWKDKGELFRAAIMRASQQVSDDTMQRLAADPEGGRFHRLWTHGMLAIFANPLLAALMRGRSDILQGLMDTIDPDLNHRMTGNAEDLVLQLQQAGVIRTDFPAPTIIFLIGAIKIGLVYMSDFTDSEHMPSIEQLTEGISEMFRRWLEPEQLPQDGTAGKQIMAEWLEQTNEIAKQVQ